MIMIYVRGYDNAKEMKLVSVRPSERQILHQQREFYAFVHFTVNTFTGKEWGDGTEDEGIFDPKKMNAAQWAEAIKKAGMKGLILTCKHHDGFCLWPSKYTLHSVAGSPYRDGAGDIVKEVSDACREYGLDFGIYLSPWDRNCSKYGQGKAYDDYFVGQLEELLTMYGEIFCVWFDGACGEGPNGKKQYYDWERYYATVRKYQPKACIHVCGPDVRWCGNEAGHTRRSEWSVVPARTRDTEKIASDSQQQDDKEFRKRKIKASDEDLGSFDLVKDEEELVWYPAEVNTSIRPGWFYHPEEDDQVKSAKELFDLYERTVGGNCTFLLNIPPTPEGLFHENDVKTLERLGCYIKEAYKDNLIGNAILVSESDDGVHSVNYIRDDNYDGWYQTKDFVRQARILALFDRERMVSKIVLKENIKLGQRVERFRITAFRNETAVYTYTGTVIGYKRIVSLPMVSASSIEIKILDSRVAPTLSFLGVY